MCDTFKTEKNFKNENIMLQNIQNNYIMLNL